MFATDFSKAVSLLQFFFILASMVSYVMLVLSLLDSYLSFLLVPLEGCG